MLLRLIALSFFLFTSAPLAKAQSQQVPSTWKNQRGSILSITSIDDKGSIKGTYVNNAAGTQCIGSPFDLSGRIKGKTIIFYVDFTGCFTVTEWRGVLRGSELPTRFEAAYPQANGKLKIWKGADVFVKQ